MSITSRKEIEICPNCSGEGEVDFDKPVWGEDSERVKVPCAQCGMTGRRIKLTTIQYLQFERGTNDNA
ncbi:MAG: hypothetical protein Q8L88_02420 [Bacteroidota bacterium]|nr:hypothetical protein [Bacteroidota bacterium]